MSENKDTHVKTHDEWIKELAILGNRRIVTLYDIQRCLIKIMSTDVGDSKFTDMKAHEAAYDVLCQYSDDLKLYSKQYREMMQESIVAEQLARETP